MLDLPLLVFALAVTIPIVIVSAEYVAACLYRTEKADSDFARPPISVLIPAHNEETPLAQTLVSVQSQLSHSDTLLVIADNCEDRTAEIARQYGANVLERQDEVNRGKGFALDAGLRYLANNKSHGDVVVMVDADCTLEENAIDLLVERAISSGRPVQGTYVMLRPENAGPAAVISELAFTLKNRARALGDEMLGWPCVLRGSGMAFPWRLLRDRNVASDHIVEDVQIGLDLTLDGKGPVFCAEAEIRSELPSSQDASKTQRTRWEHGYMSMVAHTPRLLWLGVTRLRWQLFGTAAILAIPPLSMHCAGWLGGFMLSLIAWGLGWATTLPLLVFSVSGVVFFSCTLLAWYRFARTEVPFSSLLAIPGYILGKLPIYLKFFTGRERKWVRTSRT